MIKNNICIKKILFLFILLVGILIFPTNGWAETGLDFNVQPKFSKNQLEGNSSYFDLNLKEGTIETLYLDISNSSERDIEIEVTPHTAFTNLNGVVEYAKNPEFFDSSLSQKLGELIDTPEPFILKKGETREVEIVLTMPEKKFEGLLAGGLRIEETSNKETLNSGKEGLNIENSFSYVIGIVVSNNRSAVPPELELLDVFPDQLNYRNVFSATIQNSMPTFVNQLEVEAIIRAEGKEDILYTSESTGMQMAPNSYFNYPIPLEGDRFTNGNYVANVTARSGEYEWNWEQKFTVNKETARRFNHEDVTIESVLNWWMIVASALFGVLILVIGYLIYKSKNSMKRRSIK